MSSDRDADDPMDSAHAMEIAIEQHEWEIAEKAALETLARIRKQRHRELVA